MKNKNNRISLGLSNCLDLIDKDNIQIEESDNGEIHITAQLCIEIANRCGLSKQLKRTGFDIVCKSDDIINVYADIYKTNIDVTAIIDTDELYADFLVVLTEQEIESLKHCFETVLMKQFGLTLSDILVGNFVPNA